MGIILKEAAVRLKRAVFISSEFERIYFNETRTGDSQSILKVCQRDGYAVVLTFLIIIA